MQARQDIIALVKELNMTRMDLQTFGCFFKPHLKGFIAAVDLLETSYELLSRFWSRRAGSQPSLSGFDVGLLALVNTGRVRNLIASVEARDINSLIEYSTILFHEDTGPVWINIALDCFTPSHIDAIITLCKEDKSEDVLRQNFLDYVNQKMSGSSQAPGVSIASSSSAMTLSLDDIDPACSELARMLWRVYGHNLHEQREVCALIERYLSVSPGSVRSPFPRFSQIAHLYEQRKDARSCWQRIRASNNCIDANSGLSAYQVLALSMLAGYYYYKESKKKISHHQAWVRMPILPLMFPEMIKLAPDPDPNRDLFFRNLITQLEKCEAVNVHQKRDLLDTDADEAGPACSSRP